MCLYKENIPISYAIKNIEHVAKLYSTPENKDELNGEATRKVVRKYQVYGLILRPIENGDTGEGHLECIVRTCRKDKTDEIWRHFDDHCPIREYALKNLPSLSTYTIVVVIMKDVF